MYVHNCKILFFSNPYISLNKLARESLFSQIFRQYIFMYADFYLLIKQVFQLLLLISVVKVYNWANEFLYVFFVTLPTYVYLFLFVLLPQKDYIILAINLSHKSKRTFKIRSPWIELEHKYIVGELKLLLPNSCNF